MSERRAEVCLAGRKQRGPMQKSLGSIAFGVELEKCWGSVCVGRAEVNLALASSAAETCDPELNAGKVAPQKFAQ